MQAELDEKPFILRAKTLVVGAGGIGCELLKCMALHGFKDIHVVDLDVIELSNLNRQFLFRKRHIGQPKAKVAAEAVSKMAPDVTVTAHWANIKDAAVFPLNFFTSFDLVLNALDNLDARRYVNNMCLSAQIPLIESGTAGYLGQCSVILPGDSECFDCTPKERPRSFPVCTIRTTPTSPIHCIVWAKEFLLANLFGEPAEEEFPDDIDRKLLASMKQEAEAFHELRRMAVEDEKAYPRAVARNVFQDDIQKLSEISEIWQHKSSPTPIRIDDDNVFPAPSISIDRDLDDHKVWTTKQWLQVFSQSADALRSRAFKENGQFSPIDFDKDDDQAMDFVASAANLRACIFSIPMISRFTLKSMAGNIIPAIATTNAIVAGIMVIQAVNILRGCQDRCKNVFITYGGQRSSLFANERLPPPSLDCPVCHLDRAVARLDPSRITLRAFLEVFIKEYSRLLADPSISFQDATVLEGSRILYDEDLVVNLDKLMGTIGCGESSFIKIDFLSSHIPTLIVVDSTSHRDKDVEFKFNLLRPEFRARRESPNDAEQEDGVEDAISEPPTKLSRISIEDPSVIEAEDDDIVAL